MRDFQMVYGEVFEGAIYSIRRFYSVFINAQFLLVILAIGSLLIKQPVANDNNFGENTIEQDVTFLAKANPGKMIFFTDARFDGVGNEILPMMTTAAYANYRNWVFAGVIIGGSQENPKGDDPHGVDVPSVARFIFGRPIVYRHGQGGILRKIPHLSTYVAKYSNNVLVEGEVDAILNRTADVTGPPWPADIFWLRQQQLKETYNMLTRVELPPGSPTKVVEGGIVRQARTFYLRFDDLMTETILSSLREMNKPQIKEADLLFAAGRPSVALHVRRGRDVSAKVDRLERLRRFSPDEYYFTLVERIRSVFPSADVHVFSSLEGVTSRSDFDEYAKRNMTVHFEDTVDVIKAWTNMIHADIFIMAKSSFSMVPALLNPNCVVCNMLSFDKRKLERWKTIENFTKAGIRTCYN